MKWNVDALLFIALGVVGIAREAFMLAKAEGFAWCAHLAVIIGWSAVTTLWLRKKRS